MTRDMERLYVIELFPAADMVAVCTAGAGVERPCGECLKKLRESVERVRMLRQKEEKRA